MQGRLLARNTACSGFLDAPWKPTLSLGFLSHLFEHEQEEGMKGELARFV